MKLVNVWISFACMVAGTMLLAGRLSDVAALLFVCAWCFMTFHSLRLQDDYNNYREEQYLKRRKGRA